jgi:hypothetical protein
VGYLPAGTGAVATTVQGKLRESVNVKDFGAVDDYYLSDGVTVNPTPTDNTTAIQAAIDSQTKNYAIEFSGKGYHFTTVNVTGKTSVRFRGDALIGGGFIVTGSNTVSFHDLVFDRGRTIAGKNAIELETSNSISVKGCMFAGVDKCVYVRPNVATQHVARVRISDCATRISRSDLFTVDEKNIALFPVIYYTTGFPNYFYYADNTTPSTPTIYQTGDVTIIGCNPVITNITHVVGLGQDGIVITGNTLFSSGGFYRSAVKENNIYLNKSTWAIITGNELFESGKESIKAIGVSNFTITGNLIAWPSQRDATVAGIYMTPEASDPYTSSVIAANTIRIPSGDGILLGAACNYISITGNIITTPGNSSRYYGNGVNPQGATALPTISGTKYGINVPATCSRINVVGNTNAIGNNFTPKSTSTFNNAATYNGPTNVGNIETNGETQNARITFINGIIGNTVDCQAYPNMTLVSTTGGPINTITGGSHGDRLVVFNESSPVTLTHGTTTLYLSGGVDMSLGYRKSIELRNSGGVWYEISRSV